MLKDELIEWGDNSPILASDVEMEQYLKQLEEIKFKHIGIKHSKVLKFLYDKIQQVDFREEVGYTDYEGRLTYVHYIVITVEKVIDLAKKYKFDIGNLNGRIYIYNGEWWNAIESREFEQFLGKAAEKMGVDSSKASFFKFREQLMRQFLSASTIFKPESYDDYDDKQSDKVLINLSNGTFEIDNERMKLREPEYDDYMTYQLPFAYDENADCPVFMKYLNEVLPDKNHQKIIAEYLGYLFVKTSRLKLEKALLLYGTGANGKSVLFDIVNALLGGSNNVSNFTLQNLTNENGYYRAMIGNKLVNYASEINGKMETSIFKVLVSGEPVAARLPYSEPFMIYNYAKLIFNCNELPTSVENNQAFYRRLIIIPFDVTIPVEKQDKQLAQKIIKNELSGVLNWVLAGLSRLLKQKNFTKSESVERIISQYRKQNDTFALFIEEEEYEKSYDETIKLSNLYNEYKIYCFNNNYHPLGSKQFSYELRKADIYTKRMNSGIVVYLSKKSINDKK